MICQDSLQICCPICLDIPFITYELDEFELYIIFICNTNKILKLKILNKKKNVIMSFTYRK